VLRNGDRVFDDAAFKAFDLRYLRGLCTGSHVLVNYPDSAFLRDGNRQARFGYGVHRGGQQRNIETDGTREPGGQAYIAGQDGGVGRNQQNIVEGQGFWTTRIWRSLANRHYTQSDVNRQASLDVKRVP